MDTTGGVTLSRVLNVPLDQVHDDGNDMRRTKGDARADAALTSSIRRRGVLQAIGVRPNGNGYRIVFGRRRLRCARAAGLTEIPADVRDWQDAEVRAVQGAENMQRAPVHAIDAWLTVCDLVDAGYSIAEAAEELGLDERQTRQMERLGRLHPDLLKLVEIDMPGEQHLRAIANAPRKVQGQVASGGKGKLIVRGPGERDLVLWGDIAARCKVERIARRLAIFNTAAHPGLWEEDLFAQPDDPDRETTRHIADFMKLQAEALAARVEADRAAKKRVQLAEYSEAVSGPGVALPKGWRLQGIMPNARPKRTESIFVALRPDGSIVEVLAVDVAAQRAADKAAEDRQKAKAAPAAPATVHSRTEDEGELDAGDDPAESEGDEEPAARPAEAAKPGISIAGRQAIADAKTEALRECLVGKLPDWRPAAAQFGAPGPAA